MQCVVVKAGTRCTNDSKSFAYGLTLPLVKPETTAYICGDCIYDMYQAMTARDIAHATGGRTVEQVRKEMGLA